jgi:GNAT superfamily N-acetyltransferase
MADNALYGYVPRQSNALMDAYFGREVAPWDRPGTSSPVFGTISATPDRPADWAVSSGIAETLSPTVQGFGAGQMSADALDAYRAGHSMERQDVDRPAQMRNALGSGLLAAMAMVPGFKGGKGRSPVAIENRFPGQYDIRSGGQLAGTASVAGDGTKPFISAISLEPQFQRQGIGTEVYNRIESDMGRRLVPSPLGLSSEATAFWKKRLADAAPEERVAILNEAREIGRGYGLKDADIDARLNPLSPPPGISYLDQGSRGAGEGTRNHVVFDPKTIEILRKYGLLPPAALVGGNALMGGSEDQ